MESFEIVNAAIAHDITTCPIIECGIIPRIKYPHEEDVVDEFPHKDEKAQSIIWEDRFFRYVTQLDSQDKLINAFDALRHQPEYLELLGPPSVDRSNVTKHFVLPPTDNLHRMIMEMFLNKCASNPEYGATLLFVNTLKQNVVAFRRYPSTNVEFAVLQKPIHPRKLMSHFSYKSQLGLSSHESTEFIYGSFVLMVMGPRRKDIESTHIENVTNAWNSQSEAMMLAYQ